MFISIEILLLVLYGSVTLNFNLPSCEDKKFLVLLITGNMEHDLGLNELLMPFVKVHQQAALDNIAEKQKMENELNQELLQAKLMPVDVKWSKVLSPACSTP